MSEKNKEICETSEEETLIFSCSGGADVGHLSDAAARKMMADGCGQMFCLAGIGGGVPGILKKTEEAGVILAIDGCPVDCAKKSLEAAGFSNFKHFQVTALGFDKGSTVVTDIAAKKAAEHGAGLLAS